MIHHLSITAQEPERVSRVLAELLKGHSYPFPIHPGSFITLADDEYGTAIEIYPDETVMTPGKDNEQIVFQHVSSAPTYLGTQIALSVPQDEQTIINIGDREGWRVLPCSPGPLYLIEFWLENRIMVELLTQSMLPRYLETVRSESWKNTLRRDGCTLGTAPRVKKELLNRQRSPFPEVVKSRIGNSLRHSFA